MMASKYGIIYVGFVPPEVGSVKDPIRRDHRHSDGMSSACLYAMFEIEHKQQKKERRSVRRRFLLRFWFRGRA